MYYQTTRPNFSTPAEARDYWLRYPSGAEPLTQGELIDYMRLLLPEGWDDLWFKVHQHRKACLFLVLNKYSELLLEKARYGMSDVRQSLELQYVVGLVDRNGPP